MIKFENVPYRRWIKKDDKCRLYETPQHKRIMTLIGRSIKAGKAVSYVHKIVNERPAHRAPYDVVSVRISD